MGLTKYEVKDTSFPKKEGTDDFAMSAGFFEYLKRTHNFQSKAQIENFCKYWQDRHSADDPEAWKYNKHRLWAIYGWKIMNPVVGFMLPIIVVAVLILAVCYSTSSVNTTDNLVTDYLPAPPLDYRIEVTREFKSREDFKEIAILEDHRWSKYDVISGGDKLKYFWKKKIPYVLKFMGNKVEISIVDDYRVEELTDYEEIKGKLYIYKDGNYYEYYKTQNVIPGFFDSKVRIKDDYVIWMD